MILKFLILLVVLSYVHSSPVNAVEKVEKLVNKVISDKLSNKDVVQNSPVVPVDSSIHTAAQTESDLTSSEKKLTRIVRNNKVEYVYLNADGEVISPKHSVPHAKNLVARSEESPSFHLLNSKDAEKVVSKEKEVLSKRNAELTVEEVKLDDKEGDPLHYASGVKVRGESRRLGAGKSTRTIVIPIDIRTKNILALPSNTNPGMIASPFVGQALYSNDVNLLNLQNSILPSAQLAPASYPLTYPGLAQSIYSPFPYLNNGLIGSYNPASVQLIPAVAPSVATLPTPELALTPGSLNRASIGQIWGLNDEFARNIYAPIYPNRLVSPVSWGTNLYPATSAYINPFVPYLFPQQSPNLSYLVNRGGLNNFYGLQGLGGFGGLLPELTFPTTINQLPNLIQPSTISYTPTLIPQYYPPIAQQAAYPVNQDIVTRRVIVPSTTATSEVTTNGNVLPFSDSTVTTNAASTILIPGVTDSDVDKLVLNSGEKPLLYSNQNANLRLTNVPQDSRILNSAYSNRLIDPMTGLPFVNRYPINPAYSRFYPSYPNYQTYPFVHPSAYLRPAGMINSGYAGGYYPPTYPSMLPAIYGPYNGVGYVSSMHYSADPNSLLTRKNEQVDSKPVAGKENQSKEGLMYTIKTSKSESKETVSRLDNKIRDEDKA